MSVKFSNHAIWRMKERGLVQAHVLDVLVDRRYVVAKTEPDGTEQCLFFSATAHEFILMPVRPGTIRFVLTAMPVIWRARTISPEFFKQAYEMEMGSPMPADPGGVAGDLTPDKKQPKSILPYWHIYAQRGNGSGLIKVGKVPPSATEDDFLIVVRAWLAAENLDAVRDEIQFFRASGKGKNKNLLPYLPAL